MPQTQPTTYHKPRCSRHAFWAHPASDCSKCQALQTPAQQSTLLDAYRQLRANGITHEAIVACLVWESTMGTTGMGTPMPEPCTDTTPCAKCGSTGVCEC